MTPEEKTLLDRLAFHANLQESAGNLNAARYMHQAIACIRELREHLDEATAACIRRSH